VAIWHDRADPSLVIWDAGGPGVDLPDDLVPLAVAVPAPVKDRNLLLLVEAWHQSDISLDCRRSGYWGKVEDCALDQIGTSSDDIEHTLAIAQEVTGATIDAAYLQSFGATRSFPVVSRLRAVDWVVLEAPAPPPGSSAADLFRGRAAATAETYERVCSGVEGCTGSLWPHIKSILTRYPEGAPRRELALGVLAAATREAGNRDLLVAVAEEALAGEFTVRTAARLRSLAHQYAGTTAGPRVSGAMLGVWADMCPRMRGWEAAAASKDALVSAQAWVFRGCRTDHTARPPTNARNGMAVLGVVGATDVIVPPQLQLKWKSVTPKLEILEHAEGHLLTDPKTAQKVSEWIGNTARS